MDVLKLRFVSGEDSFEFEADTLNLPSDINDGFVGFGSATGCTSGCIELFHPVHGWHRMIVNDVYPIVSNPMALDYDVVGYAITETIMELDELPAPGTSSMTKPTRIRVKPHLHLVT